MSKPRVTATDRLSNVMSVVDLGRRTGLLSVERMVGVMLEEGEIYFVSGNPIYATLGPLRGQDALVELSRWNECRFCFDPHAPQPIPNIAGVLPAVDHSSPSGFGFQYAPPSGPLGGQYGEPAGGPPSGFSPAGFSPAASGVYPGYAPNQAPSFGSGGFGSGGFGSGGFGSGGSNWSAPGQPGPRSSPAPESWQSPPQRYPSGSLGGPASSVGVGGGANPGNPGQPGQLGNPSASGVYPGVQSGYGSGPLDPDSPSGFGGSSQPSGGNVRTTDPNAQARLQRRPRRAPDVRDLINVVTTYNLTRAHRTVLLLADGEHSVLDLAQLSGKPVDEVTNLLRDLEGRRLIFYYQ